MKVLVRVMAVLAITSSLLYSVYWLNDIPPVINTAPPSVKTGTFNQEDNLNSSLTNADVDAAHAFINAYRKALSIVDDLELSIKQPIDYDLNVRKIGECKEWLFTARSILKRFVQTIDKNGYNDELRTKIMNYDFTGVIERLNLNLTTAKEAQYWLHSGQIREYLCLTIYKLNEIDQFLNSLRYSSSRHYSDFHTGSAMISRFNELFQLGNYISQLLREVRS